MEKKYLIIKAKGGMGNRMLCTATGLLYAEITGRKVFVDWRDDAYSADGLNAFPLFFSCRHCLDELPERDDLEIFPEIWSKNISKSMSQMIHMNDPNKHRSVFIHRKYSIDPSLFDGTDSILVYWSYTERINRMRGLFKDHFPNYTKLDKRLILRNIIKSKMVLQSSLTKQIAQIKSSLWSSQVIGVHVRFTDRKVNLDLYDKPIKNMLKRMPQASIFLATDNHEMVTHFKKKYQRVISTEKWFPGDDEVLHQNNSCPDKVQNGMEALIDMYLLAECNALIFPGHSTFSWIASILSNASADNLVDVTKYNIIIQLKRLVREYI